MTRVILLLVVNRDRLMIGRWTSTSTGIDGQRPTA
jgi:hypothetical protein